MGVFDSYCVICGVSIMGFTDYKFEHIETVIETGEVYTGRYTKKKKLNLSQDLVTNYRNFIKDVTKLIPKFRWTNNIYLITVDNRVIKNTKHLQLNGSGEMGKYIISEALWSAWDEYTDAIACHKDCYNFLDKKLKYKLNFDDVNSKINGYTTTLSKGYGKVMDKYTNQQHFPWTELILNVNSWSGLNQLMKDGKKLKINYKNLDFLMNPLTNKNNANRIESIWKPLIQKFPRSVRTPTKKLKLSRPSPGESATLYKVGYKKKGNDDNMYIIAENKNKVKRWKKI